MMKKKIAAAMAVTMLAASLGTTSMAATLTKQDNTDVTVKVTTTSPDQLSVTVPTTLAIAVVAGTGSDAPTTLIGSSFSSEGEILDTNDNPGTGSIRFENASTYANGDGMPITIDSAVVKNNAGSKWDLVDSVLKTDSSDKWKMNLSLNSQAAVAKPGYETAALSMGTGDEITIDSGKYKIVTVKAQAGGAKSSYDVNDEGLNKAFLIEWTISAVS